MFKATLNWIWLNNEGNMIIESPKVQMRELWAIISYLSIFTGQLSIRLSINLLGNLFAIAYQHALLFIHPTHPPPTHSVDPCKCVQRWFQSPGSWGDEIEHWGINMLQFCNVSVRLTPDTLSHVNNESDDPRVQEIEGTRWHMAQRMRHADFLLLSFFFRTQYLSWYSTAVSLFPPPPLSPLQTLNI